VNYCRKLDAISPNVHYEGDFDPVTLSNELTKYDFGLMSLNVNKENRSFLEATSPNKFYEYLNTTLPVIVTDVESHKVFVEKYNAGCYIDIHGDIRQQFEDAKKIKISKTFLHENKLTMDAHIDSLIAFYSKIAFE
jgi:hypothetical protein